MNSLKENMKLEGKVAIVTGAGGGIGRATALRMSQEGGRVMVNDKYLEKANETVNLIATQGGEATAHHADVTKSEEVREMVEQTLNLWNRIDILVNNAGANRDALLTKMTDEQWDFALNLNLKASFICARAVAPYMIRQRYGKIVNIASMAYKGNIGQCNYVSAKAGIVGLTHALGLELARYSINVNCVAPGLIETPLTSGIDTLVKQRLIEKTPMGRIGKDIDIANAVLFFVSDESGFVTRQTLHVSGGMESV